MHVDYNKVYAYYEVKISKITPINIFKQGGARPARRRWIRLCIRPKKDPEQNNMTLHVMMGKQCTIDKILNYELIFHLNSSSTEYVYAAKK